MEATHKISACYFPGKGEAELTWENLETHEKAFLTVKVDEETGSQIARTVMPCVYSNATSECHRGEE